jgi:hypothetical protein
MATNEAEQPYTKPTQHDYDGAILNFKGCFWRSSPDQRCGQDPDILMREINQNKRSYTQSIQTRMCVTGSYSGHNREAAFRDILDAMIEKAEERDDLGATMFYRNQKAMCSRGTDTSEHASPEEGLYKAFRNIFETYANMMGVEGDGISFYKDNRDLVYVPIHTQDTFEGARYMESLPYTKKQLPPPKAA